MGAGQGMAPLGAKLSVMTDLAELVRTRLSRRTRRTIADPELRRAAVLVPLYVDNG